MPRILLTMASMKRSPAAGSVTNDELSERSRSSSMRAVKGAGPSMVPRKAARRALASSSESSEERRRHRGLLGEQDGGASPGGPGLLLPDGSELSDHGMGVQLRVGLVGRGD